jgi:hypothetical protein
MHLLDAGLPLSKKVMFYLVTSTSFACFSYINEKVSILFTQPMLI